MGKYQKAKITNINEEWVHEFLALDGTSYPDSDRMLKVTRQNAAAQRQNNDSNQGQGKGRYRLAHAPERNAQFVPRGKRGGRGRGGGQRGGRTRGSAKKEKVDDEEKKSRFVVKKGSGNGNREDKWSKGEGKNQRGGNKKKEFFKKYWSIEQVEEEKEKRTVFVGELLVSGFDRRNAYCKVDGLEFDIAIEGFKDQNRSFHGDIVAVEIHPQKKWKNISKEQADKIRNSIDDEDRVYVLGLSEQSEDSDVDSEEVPESNETDSSEISEEIILSDDGTNEGDEHEEKISVPTGHVVRIMERDENQRFVGTLNPLFEDDGETVKTNWVCFRPESKRTPLFYVRPRECPKDYLENYKEFMDTLFEASFKEWSTNNHKPTGKIECELGISGDIIAESKRIIRKYSLPETELGDELVSEWADEVEITPEELEKRRDLRDWRIVSIDPATARDLDDALSCVQLPDGNFEVGVHIADVSHYVKRDSVLDLEARKRGTSVYLVQQVISMLPRKLSQNLCSLNYNVDRYAFSIVWTLNSEGDILKEWIGKSVIRTCARLAYEDAQMLLDERENGIENLRTKVESDKVDLIVDDLTHLFNLSFNLRKRRFDSGSVAMNKPQYVFSLDENRNPISFHPHEQKEANKLVEEFMLLANRQIAGFCLKQFPKLAVLRNHMEPDENKMNAVKAMCEKVGVELDATTSFDLNRSLELIPELHSDIPYFYEFLMEAVSHPMRPAEYVCTGDPKVLDYHHYALNFDHYTHFTSPIRRYPDLLVHRLVQAALDGDSDPIGELQDVIEALNISNRGKATAMKAQRDSEKTFLGVYFKNHPEIRPDCIVTQVGSNYLRVFCAGYGLTDLNLRFDDDIQTEMNEENDSVVVTWGDKIFTHRREFKLFSPILIKLQLRRRPDGTPHRPLEIEAALFREKIDWTLFQQAEAAQKKVKDESSEM